MGDFPRLIVAAPRSGEGKTTVFAALAALFLRRGLPVRAFKVGPDYIDPGLHAALTGAPSRNLDSVLMPESAIFRSLARGGVRGGLNLIEGVMGLFDGRETSESGSTAEIARILHAPVLLCLKANGFSRSAAALVRGFRDFAPAPGVAGVIVTSASAAQYALIKEIIEGEAGVPCLGHIPKDPDIVLDNRHLGLIPAEEMPHLHLRLKRIADVARLDLEAAWDIARAAPELEAGPAGPGNGNGRRVRLGVARDMAFTFYYQDNFEILEEQGAELIFFSPMRDRALPKGLDGLYLGGGFPEVFAAELAANRAMCESVRTALEAGLPCLAECGGMLYLCRGLIDAAGTRHEMAGFLPAEILMAMTLQRPFGYVEVEQDRATPLGPAGLRYLGHEFHYSRLITEEPGALMVSKSGQKPLAGGLLWKNCLGLYPHLHFAGMPEAVGNFLDFCRAGGRNKNESADVQ